MQKFLVFLLYVWCPLGSGTKWLLDNPGFDSPDAWISGYLPCAHEEVVFPADYEAVLPLPKMVAINGIVLPRDGAILLNQDTTIDLGGDDNTRRKCENGKDHKAFIKKPKTSKWFDPSSWRTKPASLQNKAQPQIEQVPCNNDSIVIQRNGPLSLDLENVPYLRLGQLSLAGSVIAKDYLTKLIMTDIGGLLFKHSDGVTVEYYRNDVCGCHRDFGKFMEPICHNVLESCPRPRCLVPITPFGSCCSICGAVLRFNVDRCDDEKLYSLRKLISVSVWEQDLSDDLVYHVDYFNSQEYGNFLQAIVVDKDGYSEKSVDFANRLNASTNWSKLFKRRHTFEVQLSGRPYNPNITFFSVLLIFLCLLLVSVVALVMFAHYVPDHRYLRRIPSWVYDPQRWRAFILRTPFVFARFDNASVGRGSIAAEGNMRESIIMGYDTESGEVRERAFDNPMFGNMPAAAGAGTGTGAGATIAVKTSSEVPSKDKIKPGRNIPTTSGSNLIVMPLVDANEEGEEQQELTEITLETSSSDDSDEEQETRE